MNVTMADGTKLAVTDHGGTGSPVVLVHCWPMDQTVFAHQAAALTAAGHRVITYDRRGFGASDKPVTGYDYGTLTADLAAVIAHCDLTDVALVGYSMGGGEVLRYLSHPEAVPVRSLTLLAAVPPFLLQTEDNPEGPLPAEQLKATQAAAAADTADFVAGIVRFFNSVDDKLLISDRDLSTAIAVAQQASTTAIIECAESWGRTDFRADVQAVDVPTLIVHGDADLAVPLAASGQLCHAMIPTSTLVVVPGAPHGLTGTHAEHVTQALVEWAEKH